MVPLSLVKKDPEHRCSVQSPVIYQHTTIMVIYILIILNYTKEIKLDPNKYHKSNKLCSPRKFYNLK